MEKLLSTDVVLNELKKMKKIYEMYLDFYNLTKKILTMIKTNML